MVDHDTQLSQGGRPWLRELLAGAGDEERAALAYLLLHNEPRFRGRVQAGVMAAELQDVSWPAGWGWREWGGGWVCGIAGRSWPGLRLARAAPRGGPGARAASTHAAATARHPEQLSTVPPLRLPLLSIMPAHRPQVSNAFARVRRELAAAMAAARAVAAAAAPAARGSRGKGGAKPKAGEPTVSFDKDNNSLIIKGSSLTTKSVADSGARVGGRAGGRAGRGGPARARCRGRLLVREPPLPPLLLPLLHEALRPLREGLGPARRLLSLIILLTKLKFILQRPP